MCYWLVSVPCVIPTTLTAALTGMFLLCVNYLLLEWTGGGRIGTWSNGGGGRIGTWSNGGGGRIGTWSNGGGGGLVRGVMGEGEDWYVE